MQEDNLLERVESEERCPYGAPPESFLPTIIDVVLAIISIAPSSPVLDVRAPLQLPLVAVVVVVARAVVLFVEVQQAPWPVTVAFLVAPPWLQEGLQVLVTPQHPRRLAVARLVEVPNLKLAVDERRKVHTGFGFP